MGDVRMLGTAAVFGLGFGVVAIRPQWGYWAASGAAYLGLWLGARYWRPVEDLPLPDQSRR